MRIVGRFQCSLFTVSYQAMCHVIFNGPIIEMVAQIYSRPNFLMKYLVCNRPIYTVFSLEIDKDDQFIKRHVGLINVISNRLH